MATEKVTIPDFGDVQDITVVEVYVAEGDTVEVEDALVALESEKAVMDIPSTAAGVVKEVYLKEEDSVKSGDAIVLVETEGGEEAEPAEEKEKAEQEPPKKEEPEQESREEATEKTDESEQEEEEPKSSHATPAVRAYARELGVDLSKISGSGPKGRILREDVDAHTAKAEKGGEPATGEPAVEQPPLEDFSKYGKIEEVELGRIKKISGPHLQKSWISIPHVTHFDEADMTDLEAFRKEINDEAGEEDIRFSPLVLITKAVVATLKAFPSFNSSLDQANGTLIYKYFYHVGIAVDTPQGLMVPVIKDADTKGMKTIATDLHNLSKAAREGKLAITDMQGASFTISSLGGIGGTGFTPIINAPQVAILGLSRNYRKPVWDEERQSFLPRLTLPFSLSYDHRVIDGAEAARFCRALSENIEDLKRALL